MNEKAKSLYVVDDKLNDVGLNLVVKQMQSNSIFERKIMQLYWFNEKCIEEIAKEPRGMTVKEFLREHGAMLYVVGEFLNLKSKQ